MSFDQNGVGRTNTNIFGFDYSEEEAEIIIVPFSWDVSCSYGIGTSKAPMKVLSASSQLDLFDPNIKDTCNRKAYMLPPELEMVSESEYLSKQASGVISYLEEGKALSVPLKDNLERINIRTAARINEVSSKIYNFLGNGKKVILLGGDHSSSLSYINALNKLDVDFGILQIDAHMDLRKEYEGFVYSHASVMYNILEQNKRSLTQVGIRDCAPAEVEYAKSKGVKVFYDAFMQDRLINGEPFSKIVDDILNTLPSNVYLSIDIDGLEPSNCPNTGTPVPGGLTYNQCLYLLKKLNEKKSIVGADLVELGPSEFDANVGSRLLWALCKLV